MAETVKIVDLDIDEKDLLKKLTKLTEEITKLKTETKSLETENKKLSSEGKKNTAQYKENSKQIEINKINTKGLSTEYRDNQKVLVTLNTTETKQLGTLQKLELSNKKLRAESKTLDLTRKKGQDRLKVINKQLDTNNKTILKNADATKKQKMNVGNYGSALQGLGGPLAMAVSGIKAMTAAAWAFIATPIGAVIAAIGVALAAVTSFFRRSEEGQDAFRKGAKVLSTVLDNFLDILDSVGEALYNAFTKPQEALENFKNFIKGLGEYFQNTFGNIIGGSIEVFVGRLTVGFADVGMAWQKFKGLFTDNAGGIIEAQAKIDKANNKIVEGQVRLTKGLIAYIEFGEKGEIRRKKFRDEIIADAEHGRRLADEEAKLRKLERRDLVENAKLAKESASARAEAQRMKHIDAERSIELFNEAFDLDEKILLSELEIAKRKAENARIAATLARSDIETLDEIARLEADIENKRKTYEEGRRARTRQLNTIRKEAFKQEKERLNAELKLNELNAAEIMRINEGIIEDERSTNEQILEAAKENTALKLQLLAEESDIELTELNSRLNLQLISQADFELQRELIKKRFTDRSSILLEENLNNELQLTKDVEQAKFDVANNVAAAVEALFAEHTIAAKFAAIAQALINTYLGATAAFAQTPGGIVTKSIAAGAATLMGLANVAKIRKVQKGQTSGGGGGGIPGGGGRASISAGSSLGGNYAAGALSDGGTTTRGITDSAAAAIKQGVSEALKESPPVLVIEDVTQKQMQQDSVSKVTTV